MPTEPSNLMLDLEQLAVKVPHPTSRTFTAISLEIEKRVNLIDGFTLYVSLSNSIDRLQPVLNPTKKRGNR